MEATSWRYCVILYSILGECGGVSRRRSEGGEAWCKGSCASAASLLDRLGKALYGRLQKRKMAFTMGRRIRYWPLDSAENHAAKWLSTTVR